jgi:hypothetical protein
MASRGQSRMGSGGKQAETLQQEGQAPEAQLAVEREEPRKVEQAAAEEGVGGATHAGGGQAEEREAGKTYQPRGERGGPEAAELKADVPVGGVSEREEGKEREPGVGI